MAPITPDLLQRAVAREPLAMREFFKRLRHFLMPWILLVLRCRGVGRHRDLVEEGNDLFQSVCVAFLENDAHLVRLWDPTRGSFEKFARMIAEQKAIATFRSGKDRLWFKLADEVGEQVEGMDCYIDSRTPERLALSREALKIILDKIRSELAERGLLLFELLIVQQRSMQEVCELMGMSESAVYAWRSRLGRRVEAIARETLS